jgi:hypothetical protein
MLIKPAERLDQYEVSKHLRENLLSHFSFDFSTYGTY